VDAAADRMARVARETIATAIGHESRHDPVLERTGGPAGNAQLTAWLGLVLLALFLVETATLLDLHGLIDVHLFVGGALVALALFKTGTTGWRIVRYYIGSPVYRDAGPPPIALRVLGPLVVLTSLAVLGTGLALTAVGSDAGRNSLLTFAGFGVSTLTLHQGAFAAWLVITGLHVLGRTMSSWQLVRRQRSDAVRVPGRGARATVIALSLALSAVVGVAVMQLSGSWRHGFGFDDSFGAHHHHDD
jgi:hypothetical protein